VVAILLPLVWRLVTLRMGRGQALEKLLLTVSVLTLPCWMLPALENRGVPSAGQGGWFLHGLLVGAPLWVTWQLQQRLVRNLFAVVGRIGLRAGAHGWARPLKEVIGSLLLLVVVSMWLLLSVVLAPIAQAGQL
jgi:hypothetical protein